jgi:cobalt-zinc-cadmium efflux system protein
MGMKAAPSMQKQSHAGHVPGSADRRALIISGWLTGIYFFVELGMAYWSGSVAVLSDAFHTFSAVGGVLIALFAQRFSERKASPIQTYGWARAEIIGALFNGIFLLLMAGYVLWMGAMRLMEPVELRTGAMLLAAAGGIATELIALRLLYGRQRENLNMRGAFWHVVQTFVGSIIIIISATVVWFTGFVAIDALLGMIFGLVLFWASWRILKDALAILLEGTPEGFDLDKAVVMIRQLAGVRDVHHVHAWSLTQGRNVFSAHIRVDVLGRDGQRVLNEAHELLRANFGIYFSTLQVEEACLDEEDPAGAIDFVQAEHASVTRAKSEVLKQESSEP